MKKIIAITFLFSLCLNIFAQKAGNTSVYDIKFESINGEPLTLKKFQGRKIMIVNTASKCGNTPQYEQLQSLYKEFGGDKLVIVGFPANNFGSQEPGTNEQIREFCDTEYGVTFPMMAKISVKGDDMHPLYKWLTNKELNGVMDSEVKWNFQKYLIDEKGNLVSVIPPKEKPRSDQIMNWIKGQ